MSEKKRFRPTIGQVRELEAEIDRLMLLNNVDGCYDKKLEAERDEWKRKFEEQLEGTSMLVADCDAWREKYRELVKEKEDLEKRHQKLKIDADNAEYDLDRSVPVDQYSEMKQKWDDLVEESANMSQELTDLRSQITTLEQSKKHMEEELNRQREANKNLSRKNMALYRENKFFKSRGFWARVFNREYVADEEQDAVC